MGGENIERGGFDLQRNYGTIMLNCYKTYINIKRLNVIKSTNNTFFILTAGKKTITLYSASQDD